MGKVAVSPKQALLPFSQVGDAETVGRSSSVIRRQRNGGRARQKQLFLCNEHRLNKCMEEARESTWWEGVK